MDGGGFNRGHTITSNLVNETTATTTNNRNLGLTRQASIKPGTPMDEIEFINKREKRFFYIATMSLVIIIIVNTILFTEFPEHFYVSTNDVTFVDGKYYIVDNDSVDANGNIIVSKAKVVDPSTVLMNSEKTQILSGPLKKSDRFLDCVYFATTQYSTIGYGDITPKYNFSKITCVFTQFIIVALSFKFIGGPVEDMFTNYVKKKYNNTKSYISGKKYNSSIAVSS